MKREDIINIIEDSTAYHLAGSYESIDQDVRSAIEAMAEAMRSRSVSPYVIRARVAHDVTIALNGGDLQDLHCYFLIPQMCVR